MSTKSHIPQIFQKGRKVIQDNLSRDNIWKKGNLSLLTLSLIRNPTPKT